MNAHPKAARNSQSDNPLPDQTLKSEKLIPLARKVFRNPLFLVIFTWILMAFLLAFEVSGK